MKKAQQWIYDMDNFLQQKCYNHRYREAAAKCPECGRFFCRECITEHDDRMLCTSCLEAMNDKTESHSAVLINIYYVGRFFLGSIMIWLMFYYIGVILLSIPASFHEGTIWSGNWIDR